MSWQKCDNAKPYSLAVPAALTLALGALHVWLSLSLVALALPSEALVLLWLLLLRSWKSVRYRAKEAASLLLSMDISDRIVINEVARSQWPGQELAGAGAWPGHGSRCRTNGAMPNHFNVEGEHAYDTEQTRKGHYTCCRSVRMPGCIYLDLLGDYGKRLEILVFYRYHQREFYLRLLRHLALK